MRKYCLKAKKYVCFFCNYRSKRKDHVYRHMKSAHAVMLNNRQRLGLSMDIDEMPNDQELYE